MRNLKFYSLILLGLLGIVSCEIDINVPDIEIDINNFLPNPSFTYPADRKAIISKGDRFDVLDELSQEKTHKIFEDQLPKADYHEERASNRHYYKFPLIDDQGTVKLLYINTYEKANEN